MSGSGTSPIAASALIPSAPVSVRFSPASLATNLRSASGKAREHLVGADRVEGGELVENEDGDFHAAIVAPPPGRRKRQKYLCPLDFCQWHRHRVALLCLEPVVAFDLSTPAEVFSLAWNEEGPLYEVTHLRSEGRIGRDDQRL